MSSTSESTANQREELRKFPTFENVCPTSQKMPTDNALENVSMYQTVDVLCEGEIEGLCDKYGNLIQITSDADKNEDGFKGIMLNDVPVKNTDSNSLNFNRTFADFRAGREKQRSLVKFDNPALSFSNAAQTFNININLPGLSANQRFISDNRQKFLVHSIEEPQKNLGASWTNEVSFHNAGNFIYAVPNLDSVGIIKTAERNQVIHANHIITNDNVNWVQVDLNVPSLVNNNKALQVNFIIKTGYVDDELTINEGGSVVYMIGSIHGISTGGYTRSYNIVLPPALEKNRKDRILKIFRIDCERAVNDVAMSKGLSVATVSEIVEQNLTYPHSALIGMLFDARAFSNPPSRRFNVKMTKVFVPNNYNTLTREYRGNWSGEFATTKKWTDNPAWCFYDLATNERYGLGKYGFRDQFVDRWNLYSIAKYCDEFVPTGYSGEYPDMDYTCEAGGIIITIDDSGADRLGKEVLFQRFPETALVVLYHNKNESNVKVDKSYKRLIFNRNYSGNNIFTFKIVKTPDVEEVFETYPEIQEAFLRQQKVNQQDAYAYILNYLTDEQNSTSDFVNAYMAGEPLGLEVRKGSAATQFHGLPLLEPRFTCNIYLDQKQNAFNALNDIAAIFRGMLYWSSGYIFAANDQAKEAVMLFTNANVSDGSFIYSGSSMTSRTTVVLVRYNDRDDSYKPKVEFVEDLAGIREFGIREKEVVALGVTSRAQANRLAKWMLYTNQTETDTVQFTTGQEGGYLRPGDVVKIQDKLKTSKRYGGRIKDINHAANSVTLDEGIEQDIVGQKITFIVPKANTTVRELNKDATSKLKIAAEEQVPAEGMTTEELDATRQTQIKQFTIASVSETNVVTISENTDDDFNLIEIGFIWSVQNTASEYEIEEVEYRVISVNEQSFNEYQVTAMMYNRSKFDAIDDSQNLTRTQQSKDITFDSGSLPSALQNLGDGATTTITIINKNTVLPQFDARFPNISTLGAFQASSIKNIFLTLNFSQLASDNGVDNKNTGGYVVEVYKSSGEKVRFSLDGFDNTEATILIGAEQDTSNMTFDIYRYDPSKRLNAGLSN
ncbi:phage tail protein [bacterium]|nr:phage tail protein [bacterium]